MNANKILILDIETSPHLAYVWKFWKENVSLGQVKDYSTILSFAAKWLGEDEIFYEENRGGNEALIVQKLVYLLDEAEFVVAHYGKKFDLPRIRGRALVHGLKPPSPFRIIDTCVIARREFGFPSNTLKYLTNVMGCSVRKGEHRNFPGFVLWVECLKGNDAAWAEMKEYNIDDILSLEELYLKMRPYISGHPNIAVYHNPEDPTCPKCASTNVQWRGYAYTNIGKYHRFQCNDCGGWGRGRYTLLSKNTNLLTN